ncbi:nitrate reductase [Histoplasma capsulatum G186AR]|uniref:Nitrate reductase n=1 Tax=Ajellomyces capsulatus TaxID=5037 RepID=A0A8H8CW44_AJECA|nr:nitrate reductase [Histoplasma capsulatum]QSS72871.1 nitrate reductase [Histoplasma capsulatum G186AR]
MVWPGRFARGINDACSWFVRILFRRCAKWRSIIVCWQNPRSERDGTSARLDPPCLPNRIRHERAFYLLCSVYMISGQQSIFLAQQCGPDG